jgi:excisionase family DNA binding protein
MAKMFYTLEEAAAKLGISEDQVKGMAEQGKLQQFRDREKVMFKREQVDELFGMARTMKLEKPAKGNDDSDVLKLDDSGEHRASKTDTIDLLGETEQHAKPVDKKSATATGISVFDADEVEAADPMAQTQVTKNFAVSDDELSLDSVGSGSGLLDLTRESDDTSLGAVELLEDIAPSGGESSDAKMSSSAGSAMPGSSTGIFEGAGGAESHPAMLSGMEEGQPMDVGVYVVEDEDPVWDGFGGGALLGVAIVLVIGIITVVTGMRGQVIGMVQRFVEKTPDNLVIYFGGMLVVAVVFGVIGLVMGKARLKKNAQNASLVA